MPDFVKRRRKNVSQGVSYRYETFLSAFMGLDNILAAKKKKCDEPGKKEQLKKKPFSFTK